MATAVLLSAGLDSAVLAAFEARDAEVQPLYIRAGLTWESAERTALERLVKAPAYARLRAVAALEFTALDLYPPSHWAITGTPPAFDTPDEDVYLAGRNVMLLSKAAIYCARHGISRLAMGPLAGNPFPDATPEFFATIGRALSLGLAHEIQIATPFANWQKRDVIRMGVELGVPLALTLSCMNPRGSAHCGQCSKCRERRDAFIDAEVPDPTTYAVTPPR